MRTFENVLPLPTSGPWPVLGVSAAAVRVEPRARAGVVCGRTGGPCNYHEHDGSGAQQYLTKILKVNALVYLFLYEVSRERTSEKYFTSANERRMPPTDQGSPCAGDRCSPNARKGSSQTPTNSYAPLHRSSKATTPVSRFRRDVVVTDVWSARGRGEECQGRAR